MVSVICRFAAVARRAASIAATSGAGSRSSRPIACTRTPSRRNSRISRQTAHLLLDRGEDAGDFFGRARQIIGRADPERNGAHPELAAPIQHLIQFAGAHRVDAAEIAQPGPASVAAIAVQDDADVPRHRTGTDLVQKLHLVARIEPRPGQPRYPADQPAQARPRRVCDLGWRANDSVAGGKGGLLRKGLIELARHGGAYSMGRTAV